MAPTSKLDTKTHSLKSVIYPNYFHIKFRLREKQNPYQFLMLEEEASAIDEFIHSSDDRRLRQQDGARATEGYEHYKCPVGGSGGRGRQRAASNSLSKKFAAPTPSKSQSKSGISTPPNC